MPSELTLYSNPEAKAVEKQLGALSPSFADVLGKIMPPERLIRTIMVSLDRNPKLYQCDRQTLFMAAMSAACLGLEVDGYTGQGFLLPFKDKRIGKRAQLIIGYLGYNTIGGRSGYTIRGNVVREGDVFEFDEPNAILVHKRKLESKGRVIAAWAKAAHGTMPPVIEVTPLDELMAVKKRSAGANNQNDDGEFSPWNDPAVGFPAMCTKTAKRRLRRSMPLNLYQLAAGMDEAAEERGLPAHINRAPGSDGLELFVGADRPVDSPLPPAIDVQPSRESMTPPNTGDFAALPSALIPKAELLRVYLRESESVARIDARWNRNETAGLLRQIKVADAEAYDKLVDVYDKHRNTLSLREEEGVQ